MKKYLAYVAVFLVGSISTAIAATALKNFPDVPQNAFYTEAVRNMVKRGIIQGFDDGTFRPNDLANRAQIVTMLDRYDKSLVTSDNDIGTLIDVVCSTTKIGDSDGTLHPRFESLCSRRHQANAVLAIDGDAAFHVNTSLLLAAHNKQQTPPPANPENLMREFSVFSYESTTGEQKEVAKIKNNFFRQPFGFLNNKIFFMNPAGELATFDVTTQKEEVIKIASILPTSQYLNANTLADFIISGNKVIYLKGDCTEATYCALGMYDLATTNDQIIIDKLNEKIDTSFLGGIRLKKYDSSKNVLTISDSAADGISAGITLYEIDLATKKITKTDSATYTYCGENDEECTPEQKAKNEKYINLSFGPEMSCDGVTVTESSYQLVLSGAVQKTLEETYYVGCIE